MHEIKKVVCEFMEIKAIDYGLDGRGQRDGDFSSLLRVQTGPRVHSEPPIKRVPGWLFPG